MSWAEKVKAYKQMKEDYGAGFDGTTELDDKYRKETPGQSSTLKRVKKLVRERMNRKRIHPRRSPSVTGVPGDNLKGKPHPGKAERAAETGAKRARHAEKVIEK